MSEEVVIERRAADPLHIDEIARADLHEIARGPCHCDVSRCVKHLADDALRASWPKIVVLCGSTRFWEEFQRASFEESLRGSIVLSVDFYPGAAHRVGTRWEESARVNGRNVGISAEEKLQLDNLHKRKIDAADEVVVLNVGGYIGKSTADDVEYAEMCGKPIRWLVAP